MNKILKIVVRKKSNKRNKTKRFKSKHESGFHSKLTKRQKFYPHKVVLLKLNEDHSDCIIKLCKNYEIHVILFLLAKLRLSKKIVKEVSSLEMKLNIAFSLIKLSK